MQDWIDAKKVKPGTRQLMLVQEIIEDDLYPEPILAPELAWMDKDGVWRDRTNRIIRVAAWLPIPQIYTLEQTSAFARGWR